MILPVGRRCCFRTHFISTVESKKPCLDNLPVTSKHACCLCDVFCLAHCCGCCRRLPISQGRVWLLKQLAAQLKPQLLSTVLKADRQLAAIQASRQPSTAAAAAVPTAALGQSNVTGPAGRKLLQASPSIAAATDGVLAAAALQQHAGPAAADGFFPPAVKARAVCAAALGMLNYLQDARLQRQMEGRCAPVCCCCCCCAVSHNAVTGIQMVFLRVQLPSRHHAVGQQNGMTA
jgi:hypothetical protein